MANKDPKTALVIGIGKPKEDESYEGEFKAPDGFDMEDKKPGDMIQAVCDLEVKKDGMLCVKKVNGIPINSDEGDDEKEEEEEVNKKMGPKGGFTDSVMTGMGQSEDGEEAM